MDPVDQAIVYLDTRQPARARELLLGALALNPTDGRTHLAMSRAEVMSGNLPAAEQHARTAAADPDTRPAALQTLSRIVGFDRARVQESVQAAAAAVQLEPQDWGHRVALALALADARDFPNATGQAQAAIQLAPSDPAERSRALMALARVFLADPANRERGYQVMRDAAALDPTDPGVQLQVMVAQFQSGRRAEAIRTALESLRVMPTSAVPPLIARFSVYFLVRRVLGWSLLVAFAVPLVFFGFVGSIGDPGLLTTAPDLVIRVGGAAGLLGLGAVIALTLRPLRDAATLRAVWRFARHSALAWSALIALGLAVLCYVLALALGSLFFVGVPFPVLILFVANIVHSFGGYSLRAPDPATLLAQQNR